MVDGAQGFASELNRLEADGDVERFVSAVFADDPELIRPEAHQRLQGAEGAHHFWRQYLTHFDSVASEFSRVVEQGSLGVLEWTSRGRLRGGGNITYSGVSLLDLDDAGRVRRFATYYDTTPFHVAGTSRTED